MRESSEETAVPTAATLGGAASSPPPPCPASSQSDTAPSGSPQAGCGFEQTTHSALFLHFREVRAREGATDPQQQNLGWGLGPGFGVQIRILSFSCSDTSQSPATSWGGEER